MLPEVIQVIPTDDYKVYVYMDDNTVRLYDAAPADCERRDLQPDPGYRDI